MLKREDLINRLIKKIMGDYADISQYEYIASQAYEMGLQYGETNKFSNSKYYHNYQFSLDDGGKISSSSFFNQFMCRTQTYAYMEAENAVKELFNDEKVAKGFINDDQDKLFHLVRDKRNDINGVFKAVMSPKEPQQLNSKDYVLVIAVFCCGVMVRE